MLYRAPAALAQGEPPAVEDPPKQPASDEQEERIPADALHNQLPGVVFEPALPSLRVVPEFGSVFPYQILGVGMLIELVPVPWLRASAEYTFGYTLSQGKPVPSHYAEGLLGLRLFGWRSESAVNIPVKAPSSAWTRRPPPLKAFVPSYHALFLEGGVMTGFVGLERCSGGCYAANHVEAPPDERQLLVPLVGLRYAFAYSAVAERQNVRKRFLLEVYADVFAPPLGAPSTPRYFENGDSAGSSGFGGRLGVDLPPFGCLAELVFGGGCLRGDVSVGYAPYPRFVYFKFELGYPFY